MKKINLILALLFVLFSNELFAQAGTLDITFSGDGKLTTDFGTGNDMGQSMIIQPNGKIVIAGFSWSGTNCLFALSRYNSDGTLDNTFGTAGLVTTDIGTGSDQVNSLALQTDGKIIAAGLSHNGTNNDFALVRYTTNGTLDTTFNHTGKVVTSLSSGNDIAYAIAIDSNDKIVVAGEAIGISNTDFAVARYNLNGSLDTSFNSTGKVIKPVGTGTDRAYALSIQSDNKILLAGYSLVGSNTDFSLARFNSDGSLDNTFSTDGILTCAIGSSDDLAYAVAVQNNGKIIAAGQALGTTTYDFALARFNADGTLDNTFSSDGKLTTAIGSGDDYIYDVAIQTDGKIVVGGYMYTGNGNSFALARYNTDGTLDLSFSSDGKVTTAIGSASGCKGIDLQADGKIVAGGYSASGSNNMFAAARYIGVSVNGMVDIDAAENSILVFPNPALYNTTIKYSLDHTDVVTIRLFDMQGKLIKTYLENQPQNGGDHLQSIDLPSEIASGMYSLVVTTGSKQTSIRIIK